LTQFGFVASGQIGPLSYAILAAPANESPVERVYPQRSYGRHFDPGEDDMARRLLTFTVAAALTLATGLALAQSPNDGPKYPNMESHKHYKDVRNLDHNNASPRYPNMESHKHYKDVRNLDHNNASPRYAVTSTASAPRARTVRRNTRYTVHASHRGVAAATHG
jgi:hypothetical protein